MNKGWKNKIKNKIHEIADLAGDAVERFYWQIMASAALFLIIIVVLAIS
jgi:hypothetical protein